jgi:hypothetical protein
MIFPFSVDYAFWRKSSAPRGREEYGKQFARVQLYKARTGASSISPTGVKEYSMGALFFDERTLKDRPRIKSCVIRSPETPSVLIVFLNWKVNQ